MSEIYVVGAGMTPFGRHLQTTVKELVRQAVAEALSDAGIEKSKINTAFFANAGQAAIEGQFMIPGQIALRAMGFCEIPIVNVENACASASTAFHLACAQLKSGESDVALVVGVEKMYTPDKEKNFAVFNGAWDVHDINGTIRNLSQLAGKADAPATLPTGPLSSSVFMDIYAALALQHMRRFGTTERQIAAVAAKNHRHSTLNPLAQYRDDMSIEQVLAARRVAWPLTVPMCSPISDGAAAAILCRKDTLKHFDRKRSVKVCASVLASGSNREVDDHQKHICHMAAMQAYDRAGIGPNEMSLAEVHDATAIG